LKRTAACGIFRLSHLCILITNKELFFYAKHPSWRVYTKVDISVPQNDQSQPTLFTLLEVFGDQVSAYNSMSHEGKGLPLLQSKVMLHEIDVLYRSYFYIAHCHQRIYIYIYIYIYLHGCNFYTIHLLYFVKEEGFSL
jgi:hypothetical protein